MQIIEGLPEEFREDAAHLYWDAFSDKLGQILAPSKKGVAYFAEILQLDKAICAFDDDGTRLLGLVGFDLGKGGIIGGGYSELMRHYGIFGGLWRGLVLEFITREVTPHSLQLDGITTTFHIRSQGVGSALIEAIIAKAKWHSKSCVTLDVVISNARAIALYERFGFARISTDHAGIVKRLCGFETTIRMKKIIQ